ncbi:MAG: hypothetical protein K6F86_10105 [Lachnospiraceae bacterium]|nr:hypothetical protein [Lachnospiraceae bacterium]
MTPVLAALLCLYLYDKKAVRIAQLCLLPAFIILPAFFRLKTTEGIFFYAGLIMIGAAPLIEILYKRCLEVLAGMKEKRQREDSDKVTQIPEDIVDNKKKWGLIKAGFAASFVLVLILVAAVLTLNSKVNNMYRFTTTQQERIDDQQREIEALKEKVEKK